MQGYAKHVMGDYEGSHKTLSVSSRDYRQLEVTLLTVNKS
jgi:hypothetical protein